MCACTPYDHNTRTCNKHTHTHHCDNVTNQTTENATEWNSLTPHTDARVLTRPLSDAAFIRSVKMGSETTAAPGRRSGSHTHKQTTQRERQREREKERRRGGEQTSRNSRRRGRRTALKQHSPQQRTREWCRQSGLSSHRRQQPHPRRPQAPEMGRVEHEEGTLDIGWIHCTVSRKGTEQVRGDFHGCRRSRTFEWSPWTCWQLVVC